MASTRTDPPFQLTFRAPEKLMGDDLLAILGIRLLCHAAGGHMIPVPPLSLAHKLAPPGE